MAKNKLNRRSLSRLVTASCLKVVVLGLDDFSGIDLKVLETTFRKKSRLHLEKVATKGFASSLLQNWKKESSSKVLPTPSDSFYSRGPFQVVNIPKEMKSVDLITKVMYDRLTLRSGSGINENKYVILKAAKRKAESEVTSNKPKKISTDNSFEKDLLSLYR